MSKNTIIGKLFPHCIKASVNLNVTSIQWASVVSCLGKRYLKMEPELSPLTHEQFLNPTTHIHLFVTIISIWSMIYYLTNIYVTQIQVVDLTTFLIKFQFMETFVKYCTSFYIIFNYITLVPLLQCNWSLRDIQTMKVNSSIRLCFMM
jgi:hypothetical protein